MTKHFQNIEKASQLFYSKKYYAALEVLEDIPHIEPYTYSTYPIQVQCYLNTGQYKKAKQLLDLAIEKRPNDDNLHYLYAHLYSKVNDIKKALQHIHIALEARPTDVTYLFTISSLYSSNNQIEQAKKYLKIGESISPNNVNIIKRKANIQMVDGEYDEALITVNRGLEISPNDSFLLSLYARIKTRSSSTIEEAEEVAYQALQQDPNDEVARKSLLEILKNRNSLLRFFVGNSFNRYKIEWTFTRVVLSIICWKGFFLWGGFLVLYLLITWYGGVLYNTVIRRHFKYKMLLNQSEINQSNLFIGLHVIFLMLSIFYNVIGVDELVWFQFFSTALLILLVGISFYEIRTTDGKIHFYLFAGFSAVIFLSTYSLPIMMGAASIVLLLLYGFLFTLRIAFV